MCGSPTFGIGGLTQQPQRAADRHLALRLRFAAEGHQPCGAGDGHQVQRSGPVAPIPQARRARNNVHQRSAANDRGSSRTLAGRQLVSFAP